LPVSFPVQIIYSIVSYAKMSPFDVLLTCGCRAYKLHQLWMLHSLQIPRRFLKVNTVSASTIFDMDMLYNLMYGLLYNLSAVQPRSKRW